MKPTLIILLCATVLLWGCGNTETVYVEKDNCKYRSDVIIRWPDEYIICDTEEWRKKILVYKIYKWNHYIYVPADWSTWERWYMECWK